MKHPFVLSRPLALLLLGMGLLQTNRVVAVGLASGIEGCPSDKVVAFRGGTFRLENDIFTNTDNDYTNGIAATAVSGDISGRLQPECLPVPVRWHAELIKFMNPGFWADAENPAHTQNVVVKFGQSMYTPEDFSRSDVVEDDRPYAGLLYGGLSWNRRKYEPEQRREMLDTRELTLGVIGSWSLAEQSQNEVHRTIGSKLFQGWHNQLRNEPAFQFAFDRKYKSFSGQEAITPGFSADTIRSFGLRVGNIETSATLGIEGRIGWNIPNDFGSYTIRPGAENRPPSAATAALRSESGDSAPEVRRVGRGVHLFAVVEGKAVAHDFSLDGNLFQSSHSVTREPWVAQGGVGISMHDIIGGRGYRLALMRVYRTREFKEQNDDHAYGSVALSVEF